MTTRKTIPVETVKFLVNEFLSNSVDDKYQAREEMGILLEKILKGTGNYKGWRLDTKHMKSNKDGSPDFTYDNVDYTRVTYY